MHTVQPLKEHDCLININSSKQHKRYDAIIFHTSLSHYRDLHRWKGHKSRSHDLHKHVNITKHRKIIHCLIIDSCCINIVKYVHLFTATILLHVWLATLSLHCRPSTFIGSKFINFEKSYNYLLIATTCSDIMVKWIHLFTAYTFYSAILLHSYISTFGYLPCLYCVPLFVLATSLNMLNLAKCYSMSS